MLHKAHDEAADDRIAQVTKRILATVSSECAPLDLDQHLEVLHRLGSVIATLATDLQLTQLKRRTDEARQQGRDEQPRPWAVAATLDKVGH